MCMPDGGKYLLGMQGSEFSGAYALRSRSALKTTDAELKLIANAAIIGDSQPVSG